MYSIGISSYYHDSSVSLFRNGNLIFACEEEKFTGIKHDSNFPFKVIEHITKEYKLTKDNVEVVCFYEDTELKKKRVTEYSKKRFFKNPIYSIKKYHNFLKNKRQLEKILPKLSNNVFYSKHHHSHLYYSAFSSPFKESAVVSIDGVGEYDTTTISYYNGKSLDIETVSSYPHSIGLFYSAMTSFLGFKPNEGEYKLMGLSSYGKNTDLVNKLNKLIKFEDGKIVCHLKYFKWDKSDTIMYNYELSELLGILPRLTEEKITQRHKDLAFAIQKVYESVFFELLSYVYEKYDTENICLGGGCAYNGLANGKIYKQTKFKHLWIPPAPSDAGSSIGAVINYHISKGKKVSIPETPFLGPSYRVNSKFKKSLKGRTFIYLDKLDVLFTIVAKEILKGSVVGFFRDEIEFGSRALGNRSILADPTNPNMKKRINELVKKREGFRPFAPMVTKEGQRNFFHVVEDVPYMNQVVRVKGDYVEELSAVTHVDGTSRIQTVDRSNPIHGLLRECEKRNGFPILLNTSFNIKDKTMVLTPEDALKTFDEVDIDVLVLQNYIIFKKKRNA
jgi:carbamoyltransferase